MSWSILSLWLIIADTVILTGDFPTQAKCLEAIKHKSSSLEHPPDIHQCVRIEKSTLHLYRQGQSIERKIYEKMVRERGLL